MLVLKFPLARLLSLVHHHPAEKFLIACPCWTRLGSAQTIHHNLFLLFSRDEDEELGKRLALAIGWRMDAPSNNHPNLATSPLVANGDPVMTLGRLVQKTQKCALCHERIPDNVKPCSFPSTAPAALAALNPHLGYEAYSSAPKVFCHTCWVWIYNLSICWTCGETVARKEEKVSFGWCWWHWACVSCTICRVGIYSPHLCIRPGSREGERGVERKEKENSCWILLNAQ